MVNIEATPDLAEASAMLDQMIAAEAGGQKPAAGSPTEAASANPEQRAAQPDGSDDQAQSKLSTDTPAGTEPAAEVKPTAEQAAEQNAAGDKKTPEASEGKSKFAKDKARRDDSWKALNAEKESFTKEREAYQAERQRWQQEREAAEASQRVTPEKYEAFARQMRQQADHLNAEANRAEEAGDLDKAEKLREEARESEVDQKRAAKKAQELRSNPQYLQQENQAQAARKQWTLKAATEFPELAKDGSEFQMTVGKVLQALPPEMKALPNAIYFASRLAAAETGAAGVPGLKERLSQAEARVKELEALTAPGAPGQPARAMGEIPFEQRSREEQMSELERLAQTAVL